MKHIDPVMSDTEIDKLIIELNAYIKQLNVALQNGCREEMNKTKEEYREIILLAGELDAYLTK